MLVSLALLALLAIGGPSAHADPPAPPPEHAALYSELSQNLAAFEVQLDAQWNGRVGNGRAFNGPAYA